MLKNTLLLSWWYTEMGGGWFGEPKNSPFYRNSLCVPAARSPSSFRSPEDVPFPRYAQIISSDLVAANIESWTNSPQCVPAATGRLCWAALAPLLEAGACCL